MFTIRIEWLLDPILIASVCYMAAFLKLAKKQYEHFFTRFIAGLWFTYVWLSPSLDVNTVRVVGRWMFIQPYLIEGLSFAFRYYFEKNNKVRAL